MTHRDQAREQVEADLENAPDSAYAERVRRTGVEREVDFELIVEAAYNLSQVNLSRYRSQWWLKRTVRKARKATDDALQAITELLWGDE